jgi:hypothetical protein
MSCGKYSGWMTDAALGELSAGREPELLAHAMECEACREALGHARKVREFVERSVESVVAGEPTPGFEMRLRRRIAQEPRPAKSHWVAWAPITAGAVVLAVLLIFGVGRLLHHHVPGPGVASTENRTASSSSGSGTVAPAARPANLRAGAGQRASERILHKRKADAGLTQVIVPRGQLLAAARLSEAINSGLVDGRQFLAGQQDSEKPLEMKPIEIAPLPPLAPHDNEEKPVIPIDF